MKKNVLQGLTGSTAFGILLFTFLHPWWNWQTRKIQVLMSRDVGVQVPPGAPYSSFFKACPLRLSARTPGSHPGKRGSTPLGGAISQKAQQMLGFVHFIECASSWHKDPGRVTVGTPLRILVAGFRMYYSVALCMTM